MTVRDILTDAIVSARRSVGSFANLQAEAILADPRIAVVELPEDIAAEGVGFGDDCVAFIPEQTGYSRPRKVMAPDEAEALAAALLAAARKARQR